MATLETNRIGGALAEFWASGAGPSRSRIESRLQIAGLSGPYAGGNKQQLVLSLIAESEEELARVIIEELAGLFRDDGLFDTSPGPFAPNPSSLEKLSRTVRAAGHELDDAGHIVWAPLKPQLPSAPPRPAPAAVPQRTTAAAQVPPSASGTGGIPTTTPAQDTMPNMPRARRSRLFIGSTVEALPVARAVHAELDYDLDVTIWNHGIFPPGTTTWAQLTESTRNYDYGLFVFSGDDEMRSRGVESLAIRDNLLIEYGLFVGVLGADRVFFLFNRDHKPKIASDLGGVTPLTYRDRDDNNVRAAVSPACDEIRRIAH